MDCKYNPFRGLLSHAKMTIVIVISATSLCGCARDVIEFLQAKAGSSSTNTGEKAGDGVELGADGHSEDTEERWPKTTTQIRPRDLEQLEILLAGLDEFSIEFPAEAIRALSHRKGTPFLRALLQYKQFNSSEVRKLLRTIDVIHLSILSAAFTSVDTFEIQYTVSFLQAVAPQASGARGGRPRPLRDTLTLQLRADETGPVSTSPFSE